jgi:cytochrome bd-type quinol oxidase subunit 2
VSLPWLLAATDTQGDWHFGIGDPTPMGWFIAFAYLAVTAACAVVWAAERKTNRLGQPASPLFWLVLTAALLFLGINKQLDLQTLLGDLGRRMAKSEGWYDRRKVYQVAFIATIAVAGLLTLVGFSWLARKQWKRNFVALLGTVFLYVFVLIRASSIHHVDVMLRWRFLGWTWNWALELGGIVVVGLGALLAWTDDRRKLAETQTSDDLQGRRWYTPERRIIVSRDDDVSQSSDRRG